jgi:L-fuconolactonase
LLIDAQVHAYEADSAARPWVHPLPDLAVPEITGDQMVAAMDAVGVDGAILVSPWLQYRTDTSYAESVFAAHPDRFRLVAPLDHLREGVAACVEQWVATPGAAGVRLFVLPRKPFGAHLPGVRDAVLGATAGGLPVNVHCWGFLDALDELAGAYPDTQFVLDHVGLAQPHFPPAPPDALEGLDQVLALARHPNLAIKLTGVCTYARRPFPFDDLWEPVARVLDGFGIERCLWGTDWQRATPLLSYREAVDAFRHHWPLSTSDRAALMGDNAARVYGWDAGGSR